MAKITGPIGPRRNIALTLKQLREESGRTLTDVAGELMISTSKLSRLENAQGQPQRRDIRDLIRHYGIEETPLADQLWQWVAAAERPGWWTDYDERCAGRPGRAPSLRGRRDGRTGLHAAVPPCLAAYRRVRPGPHSKHRASLRGLCAGELQGHRAFLSGQGTRACGPSHGAPEGAASARRAGTAQARRRDPRIRPTAVGRLARNTAGPARRSCSSARRSQTSACTSCRSRPARYSL